MTLRTLATLVTVTLASAGLTLAACDSGGGGGGGGTVAPQNTNTASAQIKDDSGGTTAPIEGSQPAGGEGIFGAGISGTILNIWITSNSGSLLSAVIDTATYELPGSAAMASPPDAPGFLTVVDALAGSTKASTGGSIVINQCPKAMGEAFTGRFDNVALRDEISGATSTLTGDFNLKVLTKAGDLACKAPVVTNPPTGEDFPAKGVASCGNLACDGPCCPYIPCLSTCTLACQTGACQDPNDFMGCITCVAACPGSCNVSQACIDAAQVVDQCEVTNGCDQIDDETDAWDTCMANACCEEIKAAY